MIWLGLIRRICWLDSYFSSGIGTPLLLLTIGCKQNDESANQQKLDNSSVTKDSVLVSIQKPTFEVSFTLTKQIGQGSAEGPKLFQRSGDLQYILEELYQDPEINISNNPYLRQNCKVDIKWSDEVRFDSVRSVVLSKIQEKLSYKTTIDTVKQKVYMLSVADASKLSEAGSHGSIPAGITFKSTIDDSVWSIVAPVPKFADELSNKMDRRVQTNYTSDKLYDFNLNIKGTTGDLKKGIEHEYGLTMKV